MSSGDYLSGLLFFLGTFGAVFAAALLVTVLRLPGLRGSARLVAFAVLATAGLVFSHLLPAMLGVLSRETAMLAALALLAVAVLLTRSGGPQRALVPPPAREPVESAPQSRLDPVHFAIAAFGVLGVAVWVLIVARDQVFAETLGYDAVNAYLPTAARWLQSGSIWQVSDWIPNNFYGAGPGNGSLIVAAAMLPWKNDFLSHMAMYPYLALLAITLSALARELGAPRAPAALLGLMLTVVPVVVQPAAVDGLADTVMYSMLAAGLLFLARHARTADRGDLLLAGLALGLSFGTKFYAYLSVLVVFAVWLAARLIARQPRREVVRDGLIVGGLIVAAGGVWMLRNWVEVGNPLLPLKVEALGTTIFDAPFDPQQDLIGYSLADYAFDPAVWGDLVDEFRLGLALPAVLLAAAVLASLAWIAARLRRGTAAPRDRFALVGAIMALGMAAAYAVTPYTAGGLEDQPFATAINSRYGIPALIAAVGVAGWLAGRLGPRALVAFELATLLAIIDALRVGPVTGTGQVWAAFAVGAVLTAVALVLRPRLERSAAAGQAGAAGRRPWPHHVRDRRALIGFSVAVLVVLGALGHPLQREFNDGRYLGLDPGFDRVIAHSGEGTSVAIVGFWSLEGVSPVFPLFGQRLENEVEFLGREDRGLLLRIDSRDAFLSELRRRNPRYLLVGTDSATELSPEHGSAPEPETLLAWSREGGYRAVARSERFTLMERARSVEAARTARFAQVADIRSG